MLEFIDQIASSPAVQHIASVVTTILTPVNNVVWGPAMLVLLLIQYLVLYWVEAGRFSALPSALGHAFLGAGVTFAVSVVILSLNSVRSGRSRRRQW